MIILMDWIARSHRTDDMVKETITSKYSKWSLEQHDVSKKAFSDNSVVYT